MRNIFARIFQTEFLWLIISIGFVSPNVSISKYRKIKNKSVPSNFSAVYLTRTIISKGLVDCVSKCEQLDSCIFAAFSNSQTSINECSHFKNFAPESQLIDSNDSTLFLKISNFNLNLKFLEFTVE